MTRMARGFLFVSAFIPILGLFGSPPDTMLLIYSLFVFGFFLRSQITFFANCISSRPKASFGVFLVISGLIAECLAWSGSYLAKDPQPALLHPQLIPDLLLGIGFYGGWALAWILALSIFRFSLISLFVTAGFLGIAIEQNGQVLTSISQMLLITPVTAITSALYVFVVYGSILGLAYLPVERRFGDVQSRDHWFKYPIALFLMWFFGQLMFFLVFLLANAAGLIPEPKPIWLHPLF